MAKDLAPRHRIFLGMDSDISTSYRINTAAPEARDSKQGKHKMKCQQGVPPLRAASGARVNADVLRKYETGNAAGWGES